jgi:spermidine synthase
MELWYTEEHTPNVRFSIKIKKQVLSAKSPFQQIDVFDSEEFGRFFTLDGVIMLTQHDEFIYHEMISHVPMSVAPAARSVLVIGGGDGGTVREIVRYGAVERIDLVDIDEMVVDVCRKHLPFTACGLEDSRVRLHFEDGLKYIRKHTDFYDLIIVDSTDPFGPGEGLFTSEFYGSCFKALAERGILVNQHENPYYGYYSHAMRRAHARIKEFFPICRVYQAHIPTYPSGHWLFGFASKKADPVADLDAAAWNALGIETRYYNTDLHTGAFMLPNYVKKQLENPS